MHRFISTEHKHAKLDVLYTAQKSIIHQAATMLPTSKNALFPGHSHLLTTGTDEPSLAGVWAIIKLLDHQYWWLAAGGYDLETGHF